MSRTGPALITAVMSEARMFKKTLQSWQYHSRSDAHSKVACWVALVDMLRSSELMQEHARAGSIGFGINHQMRDFAQNRKKDLDLVVHGAVSGSADSSGMTLVEAADKWRVPLDTATRGWLAGFSNFRSSAATGVGPVRIALEAKAAMTAHVKALPRLYDELNSSHQTVHGASSDVIAFGFVMVNVASTFRSPDLNKAGPSADGQWVVSKHKVPDAALRVVEKVLEIPRRGDAREGGFDALALIAVDCPNDGTPIRWVTDSPVSPKPGSVLHYDSAIQRAAELYLTRFGRR